MRPSLSIIIPIFNVEKYIAKCLDSVLVDNEFTGQVICVNDGSTDGSLDILEQYAAKYPNIEIITQLNAGLSAARNVGLDRAIGKYVMFIDSDDWVMPQTLEKILQRTDDEEVLYFNARTYYEDMHRLGDEIAIPNIEHMDGQSYFQSIYGKDRNLPYVSVCGGLYKRTFLKENNLYNALGIYHEDNYFTPQVLLAAKDVSSIDECVYVRRRRAGSITASVTQKHIMDLLYVARNLYAIYEKQHNTRSVFYKDLCGNYVNVIYWSYNNAIPLSRLWKLSDSTIMLQCAHDLRTQKIAKLTYVHPYVSYLYMQNLLPSLMRRLINRFL